MRLKILIPIVVAVSIVVITTLTLIIVYSLNSLKPCPLKDSTLSIDTRGNSIIAFSEMVWPDSGISTFHVSNDKMTDILYPLGSVLYVRWTWRELEPEKGVYHFDLIDTLIEDAVLSNQDIAFRVMADIGTSGGDVPQWLIDLGGVGVNYGLAFSPDYDSEVFLEHVEALILALGERYDGHARISHVDIGIVGLAGEWHVSHVASAILPMRASWERIIDVHAAAFRITPIVMLFGDIDDGGEPLRYAIENHGAGMRADCLGDTRNGWNHMDNFYLQRINESGAADVWKTAPVHFETCGTFETWKFFGAKAACNLNYALDLHVSVLNAKSSPVPSSFTEQVEIFNSLAGYRLNLDNFSHSIDGSNLNIQTVWTNIGVAPPYRDFYIAYDITNVDTGESRISTQGKTIKGWLPREQYNINDILDLPIPGSYDISFLLLDTAGDERIRLNEVLPFTVPVIS